ncbi:hypothetical protein O9992_07095 [Vibrio lentus]|nr:hypothetical protein [Vibrio lentus]
MEIAKSQESLLCCHSTQGEQRQVSIVEVCPYSSWLTVGMPNESN